MIIFTPTIQHSGTWFLLRFLEHYIPNIREVWHVLQENKPVAEPAILHTHFPVIDSFSLPNKKSLPLESIQTLANLFKTVIPIRDPLASILTRECRHPEYRHFYIVDGFVNAINMFDGHENVAFLPIDLYNSVEDRRGVLEKILIHCGLPVKEPIDQIAKQWTPENPTPNNRFRDLYVNKQWDQIRMLLGPKNAEIEYLKNKAFIIKPFLTKLGYTDLWP